MNSVFHACSGITYTFRTQANFRIEVFAALTSICAGVLMNIDLIPIMLCCALVLSLELLNTSLEALTDLACPELHPLAKSAKDAAAAAVLVASLGSLGVGIVLFLPAVIRFFHV